MNRLTPDLDLRPPRWATAALLAAALTLAACWPPWPGFMSYDSLFAYKEARLGVETMLWPPLHAYLFWISERLGAGPGGLFAAQAFGLFFAAGLTFSLFLRSRALLVAAVLAFAALFLWFPTLLGVLFVQWRDVPTASFVLLGLALWLVAVRSRAYAPLVAALACYSAAVGLRYNAFALAAFPLALALVFPFWNRSTGRARLVACAATALGLGLAWGSTVWRLPDLARLPAPQGFSATQAFDLIGVSACAGRNYLPPAVTGDRPISAAQVRRVYDPRHLQMAYRAEPGQPQLLETDGGGQVQAAWRRVVPRAFDCYLTHRALVLGEQMGMAPRGVFYPVHAAIDANDFGIVLARPQAAADAAAYVIRAADAPWRRPWILYLLAGAAVTLAWLRRAPERLVLAAVLAGAFAYPALLFVAAPAADARYIFPSNVCCALLVVLGAAALRRRPAG